MRPGTGETRRKRSFAVPVIKSGLMDDTLLGLDRASGRFVKAMGQGPSAGLPSPRLRHLRGEGRGEGGFHENSRCRLDRTIGVPGDQPEGSHGTISPLTADFGET